MPDTSTRFAISEPLADRTDAADVPLYVRNIVTALEAKGAMYSQGTFVSRPVSSVGSPGKQGRFFYATDTVVLYYDFGTGWSAVGLTSIAAGSIGTTELADNAVTLAKMADDSVSAAEIVNSSITAAEIADALKPSAGAAGATEALRALGTAAGTAATGQHETQHLPAGADALPWTTIHGFGTFASRPAAASSNLGYYYFATDTKSLYQQQSGSWVMINSSSVYSTTVGDGATTSIAVTHSLGSQNVIVQVRQSASPYASVHPEIQYTDSNTVTLIFDVAPTAAQYTVTVMGGTNATATTPAAHASSHLPGGSDAIVWSTIHGRGTFASRPVAAASNANCRYVSTDTGAEFQSDGAAWNLIRAGSSLIATTLPSSPVDGQQTILTDSTSAPTWAWMLQWSASAAKWLYMGGSRLYSAVETSQSPASTVGFVDLTTVGPSFVVPAAGTYTIDAGFSNSDPTNPAQAQLFSVNGNALIGIAIDGTTNTGGTNSTAANERTQNIAGLTVGDTVKLRYNAGSLATVFKARWLTVAPVWVT